MAGIAGNSTQSFAAMMNDVAPPLGAMLSSGLAFGPMAAVLEARKAGSLGDVNSDVFPVLFVNCIAWAIYGKMTNQFFVYAGNIAGMVMGLWYVLSSYGLATHDVRKKIELVTIGLVASLVATITFGGIVYGGNEVATMGIFANVIVFVVFSSPLSTLAMVVREKNSASINRPFGIVQVLNCLTWTFYSLFIADWYLFVPNLVGLVLGLVQCALMLIFPAKKCIKIDELSEPVPRSVESLLQESSESLP